MREEFERKKGNIFVQCKCDKECTNPNCDKRKLGLMKLESMSTHAIAITSKTHTEWVIDPLHAATKTSSKGVPSKCLPSDTLSMFYTVLTEGTSFSTPIETFQLESDDNGGRVVRKEVIRTGITHSYNNKRKLLDDNVTTIGIPFEVYAGPPKNTRGCSLKITLGRGKKEFREI